jgi:ABC-type tungstate transport system permease subunit
LEETIRHAKCLYDQQRGRQTFQKAWEDKMKSKVEHRKKGDNSGTKVMEKTYAVLGFWQKSYVQRFPSKR